jgi:hypothetical protein
MVEVVGVERTLQVLALALVQVLVLALVLTPPPHYQAWRRQACPAGRG